MRELSLLSYNIEVGIETRDYADYIMGGWKHLLPTDNRQKNLDKIAAFIQQFDIVALQEVDSGSLRSGFINQVEYLADKSGFPFWHCQVNRNLGKLAKHSNGLLSKPKPLHLTDHKLPGFLPGRGAIAAQYGTGDEALILVIVHLALGYRSRMKQLSYIADFVRSYRHIILMGDMNCSYPFLSKHAAFRHLGLFPIRHGHTYPSWRPIRSLDHILVGPSIQVTDVAVLQQQYSDHLPVAVQVKLPGDSF